MSNDIIVTGSLAFDFIMDFPGKFSDHILPEKIHEINLSFLVKTLKRQRGGTAGNIAYNLALLGMKPSIFATAGNDFSEYKRELEKVGVNTLMIYIIKAEPTASAYIFTDQADNQITGFYPGAMKYAKKLFIKGHAEVARQQFFSESNRSLKEEKLFYRRNSLRIPQKIGRAPRMPFVVISPNEPSAMIKFVKDCIKYKIPYMFDPGMQLPRLSDKDLRLGIEGAKIVIGNDYEMSLIQKRLDTSDGVRSTPPRWGGKVANSSTVRGAPSGHLGGVPLATDQLWITTLGENGSVIETDGKKYIIPSAKPKAVLDPTGAGDAFRAGFLAGFLTGQPLDVCGRMGSVCAVYTVEKYGTQTHKFTISEFKKRYEENFKERLEVSS